MTGGVPPRVPSARGPVVLGLFALALLLGGFGLWSVTTRIAGGAAILEHRGWYRNSGA